MALAAVVERYPRLGFRVYQTRNGLRYLCTTHRFDPLSPHTHRLMHSLYVDPLYARLCQFQNTFRARLSPKPWRVKPSQEDGRYIYDRRTGTVLPETSEYAVCHLLKVMGDRRILPEFETLVRLHDDYCCVQRLNLELA